MKYRLAQTASDMDTLQVLIRSVWMYWEVLSAFLLLVATFLGLLNCRWTWECMSTLQDWRPEFPLPLQCWRTLSGSARFPCAMHLPPHCFPSAEYKQKKLRMCEQRCNLGKLSTVISLFLIHVRFRYRCNHWNMHGCYWRWVINLNLFKITSQYHISMQECNTHRSL